jgi:hypothetical protein
MLFLMKSRTSSSLNRNVPSCVSLISRSSIESNQSKAWTQVSKSDRRNKQKSCIDNIFYNNIQNETKNKFRSSLRQTKLMFVSSYVFIML